MERTLYSSTKLQIDIVLIPALGFAVGYEKKYRELSLILGCLLIKL